MQREKNGNEEMSKRCPVLDLKKLSLAEFVRKFYEAGLTKSWELDLLKNEVFLICLVFLGR